MNKKLYIWSCDLEMFRGEGILAWLFISKLIKYYKSFSVVESFNKKIIFKNISKKIINNKVTLKLNFFLKYILPYYGVFKCWKYFLLGYKVSYVNYLPLWNPLLFFLLPPNTILGPITGGVVFNQKSLSSIVLRKYIFPFLYKVSIILIKNHKKLIFSTSLLKSFLNKNLKKKCIFDFAILHFFLKKKKIKNIDLIIYFRNHNNKSNDFLFEIVRELVSKGVKIVVIGDYFNVQGVKNKGNIERDRTIKLIQSCRFAINSGENSLSLFVLDCLSNFTRVFCNKHHISKSLLNLEKIVIPVNFQNIKLAKTSIYNQIKNNDKIFFNFDILNYQKRTIEKLVNNFFVE